MSSRLVLLATAAVLAPASAAVAQHAPPPAQTPAPAPAPARPSGQSTAVEGVTVTGASDYRGAIDRRSYSLAGDLQATTGSIGDALRSVPGVEVDVQGNISLRGDSNVTILIDGKPSSMFSGDARADALQNMPADQIERVEVMTNPSAAFSPEGSAGVINLVTKRAKRQTRYATVRGNVGTGERYNGGVSGSFTDGRLTLSGDLGFRRDGHEFVSESERERFDSGLGQFLESRQQVESEGRGRSLTGRASLDYDLDAANRISGQVRFWDGRFSMDTDERYEADDVSGVLDTAYERVAEMRMERSNVAASARWRRQFAGDEHDLTVDLSYDHTTGERDLRATTEFLLPPDPSEFERIRGSSDQDLWRLKADYQRPLADGARLKLGSELELTDNDFDSRGERGPTPGATVIDPSLTNRFLHEQAVQAVYATYERPFGKLTVLGGLRLEGVQTDIDQVTSGITDASSYTGVYPSLHLGYDLAEGQQLKASYSRRIQRPSPQDLNPYVVYIDPFNLRAGNPDLEPEIINSYELGWEYRSGPTFYLATLYYRERSDGVTDVVQDLGNGVFLTTRENLAESRNGGVELVANGRLGPTLTYNLSANGYWNEIDASGLGLGAKDRSGWTLGGRGSLSWQATPKDFLQVSAFFMGDRITPQGEREGGGMVNLGYRHKFTDDLSLVVTAQDIFDTFEDAQIIDTPLLRERVERDFSARNLYVGFTWSFGSGRRPPQRDGFEFDTTGGAPPG